MEGLLYIKLVVLSQLEAMFNENKTLTKAKDYKVLKKLRNDYHSYRNRYNRSKYNHKKK